MKEMIFQHPYNYACVPEPPCEEESITEQSGYVSTQEQVESFIMAGRRLEASRCGYEFEPDEVIPDDYWDPSSVYGMDLVEAQSFLNQKVEQYHAAVAERDARLAEKQKLDAAAGSGGTKVIDTTTGGDK